MKKVQKAVLGVGALALCTAAGPADFCARFPCPTPLPIDADQLQMAWSTDATTDEQRAEMGRTIEASKHNGVVDWRAAATSYFDWRRSKFGVPMVHTSSQATNQSEGPEAEWERLRPIAESAIRSRLIDPSSAEFNWPSGFINGYWKPFLMGRQFGLVTCGEVNSKNRLGGYVGATPFAVVMNNDSVTYVEIAQKRDLDFTAIGCQKFSASLPTWRHVYQPSSTPPVRSSLAKDLQDLADLRAKGMLNEQEFAAAKAKLLSGSQ